MSTRSLILSLALLAFGAGAGRQLSDDGFRQIAGHAADLGQALAAGFRDLGFRLANFLGDGGFSFFLLGREFPLHLGAHGFHRGARVRARLGDGLFG